MSLLSKLKKAVLGLALAALASAAAADEPTIGVVVPTLDAQFWNNYVDFMKKGAGELGVKLVVLNADNKPDQMVKSLEDLVAQNVSGIIFTPYWATAARGLTLAKEADIPVILTDSYPDFSPQSSRFPNYVAFIGPSDEDAGYQMAKTLFVAIKPGSSGFVGVSLGFWAFGIGTVTGIAATLMLNRSLRPTDPDLLADSMNADAF